MMWLFVVLAGMLGGVAWYLYDKITEYKYVIEQYRAVVLEWTLYMHEKDNGRDFALWRKEFGE